MIKFKINTVLAAILFMASILTFTSCSKDEDTDPDQEIEVMTNEIPEDVLYYFSGKVDGVQTDIHVTLTNDMILYHTNGGSLAAPACTFDYGAWVGHQDTETPPAFSFDLYRFFDGMCDREIDVFNTLITTGNVSFATDPDVEQMKSVGVGFQNASGNYTSMNPANSQNSTFTISKSEAGNNAFGKYQILEGTVNCTLYKEDDPDQSIRIEDGKFRVDVSAYFN